MRLQRLCGAARAEGSASDAVASDAVGLLFNLLIFISFTVVYFSDFSPENG